MARMLRWKWRDPIVGNAKNFNYVLITCGRARVSWKGVVVGNTNNHSSISILLKD